METNRSADQLKPWHGHEDDMRSDFSDASEDDDRSSEGTDAEADIDADDDEDDEPESPETGDRQDGQAVGLKNAQARPASQMQVKADT